MDYESLSNDYVLNAARREKSLIFERAEGSRLWDIHGKVYLDTMSGSAGPAMVGHANPAVADRYHAVHPPSTTRLWPVT